LKEDSLEVNASTDAFHDLEIGGIGGWNDRPTTVPIAWAIATVEDYPKFNITVEQAFDREPLSAIQDYCGAGFRLGAI
jgi:hypothetical protein